ncbi:hypothetical protein DH2020_019058 [Rehmannia glutinosa]|uniref:Chromo domain-containing protein n=1 Tax=Rehmannia glutinosa TaxID=99300 RepID=A0ABR0WKQ2_REHGL
MYKDLKQNYWWVNMKNQFFEYVSRCLTCQQVKSSNNPRTNPHAQSRLKKLRRSKKKRFRVYNETKYLKIVSTKGYDSSQEGWEIKSRYIGPFKILERIGTVAYRLDLPPKLARMHNVFHVSRLKKYHPDLEHIIKDNIPQVMENLTYEEKPLRIIDRQVRELRNKSIPLVKVVWRNHDKIEEATWETETICEHAIRELFQEENLETKLF